MNLLQQTFCSVCPVSQQIQSHYAKTESGSRVWLNGDGTFSELPEQKNRYHSQGQSYDFFESVVDFRESNSQMAVIPVVCVDRKIKKKRYYVEVLCRAEVTTIYNVELIRGNWMRNENDKRDKNSPKKGIEICEVGKAYLMLVVRENDSICGFRVKGVKPIR